MKEADIRRYAALMGELGLTAFEITQEDSRLRLERSAPSPSQEAAHPETAPAAQAAAGSRDQISVTSPLVGVFYAAPAEDATAFVSLGDTVTKGQTLCIIEAMKLMNEIVAEESGVIAEICATNGQVVEYGTVLFRIER